MQSMLESTSSTSTVTLDELAESTLLDDEDDFLGRDFSSSSLPSSAPASASVSVRSPSSDNSTTAAELGVEDGLQSFRLSGFDLGLDFELGDAFRLGWFDLSSHHESSEPDEAAASFPMSVRGSLSGSAASSPSRSEKAFGVNTPSGKGKGRARSRSPTNSAGVNGLRETLRGDDIPVPPLPTSIFAA